MYFRLKKYIVHRSCETSINSSLETEPYLISCQYKISLCQQLDHCFKKHFLKKTIDHYAIARYILHPLSDKHLSSKQRQFIDDAPILLQIRKWQSNNLWAIYKLVLSIHNSILPIHPQVCRRACVWKLPLSIFNCMLLLPFQIVSHSNIFGESKHFKFDQVYTINY